MTTNESQPGADSLVSQIASLLDEGGNSYLPDDVSDEQNSAPQRVHDEGNNVANDGESVQEPEQSDHPESSDIEAAQDESPAIVPPKSWNAAEKELFQELPPEAQSVIAR